MSRPEDDPLYQEFKKLLTRADELTNGVIKRLEKDQSNLTEEIDRYIQEGAELDKQIEASIDRLWPEKGGE